MNRRPGGELSRRPLHFIWIADCSGSMAGEKIEQLNIAIREALPHMREVADDNPNAEVLVRAVRFSSGAQWHVSQPTKVSDFAWIDLVAGGETDLGAALELVADQLEIPPMSERALPPVLVLLSDGQPTDSYRTGLQRLMQLPWGKRAIRLAIAIGEDADYPCLQDFIGHMERAPLRANSPEQLVRYIVWLTTVVLKTVSRPPSQVGGGAAGADSVPIPEPPAPEPLSMPVVW